MERKFIIGMRQIDEDKWPTMFQFFLDETDPIEKNKLMKGLASVKSSTILKELVY